MSDTPVSDMAAKLNDPIAQYVESCNLERMLTDRILEVCKQAIDNARKEDRIEQLERELADASKEIQRIQAMPEYDYAFDNGVRSVQDKLNELSALEKQIADGELVPCDVAVQWSCEIPFGTMSLPHYAKQLASEKEK